MRRRRKEITEEIAKGMEKGFIKIIRVDPDGQPVYALTIAGYEYALNLAGMN